MVKDWSAVDENVYRDLFFDSLANDGFFCDTLWKWITYKLKISFSHFICNTVCLRRTRWMLSRLCWRNMKHLKELRPHKRRDFLLLNELLRSVGTTLFLCSIVTMIFPTLMCTSWCNISSVSSVYIRSGSASRQNKLYFWCFVWVWYRLLLDCREVWTVRQVGGVGDSWNCGIVRGVSRPSTRCSILAWRSPRRRRTPTSTWRNSCRRLNQSQLLLHCLIFSYVCMHTI